MASDGGGGALDGEEGWEIRKAPEPQLQLVNTTITTTTTSQGDVGRGGYGGSSYGGVGKSRAIRLKSGRKGLPYERPSVGRSAAAGPQAAAILSAASARALSEKAEGAKAWFGSGFSKIISTGATYLYSSIFRRNNLALSAPLPVSDVEAHQLDEDEHIASPRVDADDNQVVNDQNGLVGTHNYVEPQVVNSSDSDVEQLLTKKTLSRDEFQRLTVLLQSRVVSHGLEKKQQPKHVEDIRSIRQDVHPSCGNLSEAQRWREDLQKSREEREDAVRTLTVYENGGPSSATQAGVPESLDGLSSSPVEVAIAFMGGRGSRMGETPSTEPLNQRDENRTSSGPLPSLNVPQTSLAKWTDPDFLTEDQFSTPPRPTIQSWGRNRTISRTPYSRPLRLPPSRERAIDGTFGTPSATRWTPIRAPVTGGREMLKRRSTVLDEGWTSGGPIRRTRHKAIVSTRPSNLSQSRGLAFPATPLPRSSLLSLPSSLGGKHSEVTLSPGNPLPSPTKEKNVLTASGNFYVPAQSSATARKILETLEKMTPSPKGKSLGDELAFVRERPPTALTEGMLNDQARKSMTFVDYTSSSDSREPGPSGRTEESPSLGYPGSLFKMSDASIKAKEKGKGPLPPIENGPIRSGGLPTAQERTNTADGSTKQFSVRPKEITASENNRGKGFRMSAVFEESGSEDEGRLVNKIVSPPPISTPRSPTAFIRAAVTPSVFGPVTSGPTTTSWAGLPSVSPSVPAVDTSKTFSSGFCFPTRASLEGPPTPKAMLPASTSPKATTATPFFQFAQTVEQPAASGSTGEASSTPVKSESQPDTKTEFSFGSPAPVANEAVSKAQPTHVFSNIIFKQSSPPLTASSSAVAPAVFPSFTSAGATDASVAPSSSKLGDTLSAPMGSTAFEVAVITSGASPFGPLFTSSSSSAQSASVAAPSTNLFSSNTGSGSAPAPNLFASDFKTGTSAAPVFGQSNSFVFKTTSSTSGPLVSPDSQASGTEDDAIPFPDFERPRKRSMSSSFQQDLSKRQQPPATTPSHIFTSFGTTLATSAATPAIPVTFATGGQNTSASQGLFSVPSFGHASSSASQTSSPLSSAVGIPAFPFGTPATSAGNTSSASSSAGFGSAPSFPSFPGSVFGTVSSGSTFGLTPGPAPGAFGSTATTPAFGSTSASSVFGGFTSEAVSQSPPTPVFGSGFASPSPSTSSAFSFGASSPSFSFGPSAASSSGSAFTFGSAGSFPFAANKSAPSPVFGLSNSVPAFGSTTNGTMPNDVVVNDQSNMDDNSMAEEPSQIGGSISPQPSIFGALSSAGAGSFVFGAQAGALGTTTSQAIFGGFSNSTNPAGFGAAPANPFAVPQPAGSLDFAGGSFTLGSGGDRPQRKMFKAKRTGAKRGK